ncbi:hypothetical protein JHK86_041786 [Glycine max]|nr:hypothetical protein JHK86_041786 [Glycine max]
MRKMGCQLKTHLFLLFIVWGSWSFLCYDLPSEYSILALEIDKFPSEEGVVELFQRWKEENKKIYRNPEEEKLRFENFKRNLKYIVEKNSKRISPYGQSLGLNQFADMSNEEFKSKFMSKVKKPFSKRNGVSSKDHSCEDEPYSLDWRKKGEKTKVIGIDGYYDVGQSDSSLLCATVKQPISAGIDGTSWDFQLYIGGIYDGDCSSDPDDIDHAILVVGYGSEGDDDYWIVKNSWRTSWGMEGCIYLRKNTNLKYGVCNQLHGLLSYQRAYYTIPK